jgi:hypothetical protein
MAPQLPAAFAADVAAMSGSSSHAPPPPVPVCPQHPPSRQHHEQHPPLTFSARGSLTAVMPRPPLDAAAVSGASYGKATPSMAIVRGPLAGSRIVSCGLSRGMLRTRRRWESTRRA